MKTNFKKIEPISFFFTSFFLMMFYFNFNVIAHNNAINSTMNKKWNGTVKKIKEDIDNSSSDIKKISDSIKLDKKQLLLKIAELKKQIKKKKITLDGKKKTFKTLLVHEENLQKSLEKENEEIRTVEGTVKSFAKEFDALLKENHIGPDMKKRHEQIRGIIESKQFPGMEGVRAVSEGFFEIMDESGRITRKKDIFTGNSGSDETGEIIRIGSFTSYYKSSNGKTGFLYPNSSGDKFNIVSGKLPGYTQSSISKCFEGEDNYYTIDISKGSVFKLLKKKKDLMEILKAGGIMVWPIIIVGIVAVIIAIERFIRLSLKKKLPENLLEKIISLMKEKDMSACIKLCVKNKSIPACRVLENIAKQTGKTKDIIDNAIQEAILIELSGIEKYLSTLKILAAIAPLLGLLGTVTGMINTFQVISTFGTGDPRMMSGGISEALITTQIGLTVAVPILILHHILEKKSNMLIGDMEEKSTSFAASILNNEFLKKDNK